MKLNKRDCGIRIRLTPCGADFQKIQWSIGGDHHTFWPSAVMGGQFSDLITAVYCLYSEEYDEHTNCRRSIHHYEHKWDAEVLTTTAELVWDEEERTDHIVLIRRSVNWKKPTPEQYDPVEIEMSYRGNLFHYVVDGRDLCYAVAKASTAALKRYGFRGYYISSGSLSCPGDPVNIERLLFVKAYALNVMEVRGIATAWKDPDPTGWMRAECSSFDDEIELLLFDM